MWLRTHFTMTLRQRHPDDISGQHRAVIELAVAMQTELDIHDVHPSLLREKQLRERVDKELKGGAISYAYSKADLPTYSIKTGLKAWFRKERWWFSAIVTMSVFCSTFWMAPWRPGTFWFWCWTFGIWLGQVWAFCIGTTNGSSALVILFWCIISAIVVIGCKISYPYIL